MSVNANIFNPQFARRAIRSEPNPIDKCTVVSIYPRPVYVRNYTVQPGEWLVEKGSWDKPSILVVGPSSWWKDTGPDEPLIEIVHNSMQMADSIVRDYCNGLLEYNAQFAHPGLFFIPGEKKLVEVMKDYKHLLETSREKQKNWYMKLVEQADTLWARTNGNPLSISDDMRLAAQELQLKTKPWMQDFTTIELNNCPACGNLVNINYPVCQHCHHVINAARYKELGLVKAS